MLTEPLTAPPTRDLKRIYAVLTGFLFIPQIHVLQLYSTPELALIVGNVFSYLVSPKRRVVLTLKKKTKLAPDILDFVFAPSRRLAFVPGQYIECTLEHPHPDGGATAAISRWRPRPRRTMSTSAYASIRAAAASSARWPPCPTGATHRRRSGRRGLHAARRPLAEAGLHRRRHRHHAVPQHAEISRGYEAAARHRAALRQPAGGRDRLPRRTGRGAGGTRRKVAYTLTETSALPKDWAGYTAASPRA